MRGTTLTTSYDHHQGDSYDPDPVSILALIAAIIGAVPGATAIWAWIPKSATDRLVLIEKAESLINQILDELDHLEVSFNIIRRVIVEENLPLDSPFELGHQLFLSKIQFKRYNEATQDIHRRGARIDASLHHLLTSAPMIQTDDMASFDRSAVEVYRSLNRLYRSRDLTISGALKAIQDALNDSRDLLSTLKTVRLRELAN
jgi:hypothetical protein